MGHWNTTQIIQDLSTIVGIVEITNSDQLGDYTTDQLIIRVGGCKDQLWIVGFNAEGIINSPSDVDVKYIEVTDRLTSIGGLNSTDYQCARIYIDVRQYFLNRNFVVVRQMEYYF